MSKKFQMLPFSGSTQEKWPSKIFGFGYRKAANDKMVPDRLGSGVSEGSPSHDVNSENAALMTREQIIDEITND
jgi:hypothetical protein